MRGLRQNNYSMDERKLALQNVLIKIEKGRITEKNIAYIEQYANKKSEWLCDVDNHQLLIISDVLKNYISSFGSEALNLRVMILILEAYSAQKSGNSGLLGKTCLPAIFQYVERAIGKSKDKIKAHDKSALQKILSLLTNLKLPFAVIPKRLLKTILQIITNDVSDFDEFCLLFLLSLPKTEEVMYFVSQTFCKIIEGPSAGFKKKVVIDDTKLPMQFLFLISYTQGLLSDDQDDAYMKSFSFTACFIDNLYNKCCDNQHAKAYTTFAEDYLAFLISLGNDPVWPVVSFILQLITKFIWSKLQSPDTNVRLQSFLIKQIPRIAERSKGCETEEGKIGEDYNQQDLQTKVIAYIQTLLRDYIKGDIGQAFKNLWAKFLPGMVREETIDMASREEAIQAATILEGKQGRLKLIEFLRLLLICSDRSNKIVKTNAVKALSKIILLQPSYLSYPKVQLVLGDSLEALNASGRISIGNMLATFLSTEPALTEKFAHIFMVLLKDDAFTVRRTAINALGEICAVDYFRGMETLAAKILLMFYDPDIAVQFAVLQFFSNVFVKRVKHLGCLVEINVNASIRQIMVPILKRLVDSGGNDLAELKLLAEAVVLYLKNNSVEKKKLAAAVVLESLAKVSPACILIQLPDIVKLTFCSEPYLMKKLCSVLVSASEVIHENVKANIYASVKKIITKRFDWKRLSPCVLKLLTVLTTFATENVFEKFIQPCLNILIKPRHDVSDPSTLFLPLSIVAFLCKDEQYEGVQNILMEFLREPPYQMIVLSAMAEARLETAPKNANPVLNGLINNFIRDTNNPHMVITGLQYLNSCLLCDELKYEKPEMKQLGDSTTASLSQLLQETLQAVLACTLHLHLDIRRTACGVIRRIVESGLLLQSRFVPYLVAMTADDCSEIRHAALESLKRMPEAEVAIFAMEGLCLAYTLRKVLHPESVQRGTVNGRSICHEVFVLIRTCSKIRQLLENLVTEATKKTVVEEVVFFVDNIVFYPYKAANAVDHVSKVLEKAIFEFRKMFHCRLLKMAKTCLDKTYKISESKWCQDKLQRAVITDYLEPSTCNALNNVNGKKSCLELLMCHKDFDVKVESEKPLGENPDKDDNITKIHQKPNESVTESGGTTRKQRRTSGIAKKRVTFAQTEASQQFINTENALLPEKPDEDDIVSNIQRKEESGTESGGNKPKQFRAPVIKLKRIKLEACNGAESPQQFIITETGIAPKWPLRENPEEDDIVTNIQRKEESGTESGGNERKKRRASAIARKRIKFEACDVTESSQQFIITETGLVPGKPLEEIADVDDIVSDESGSESAGNKRKRRRASTIARKRIKLDACNEAESSQQFLNIETALAPEKPLEEIADVEAFVSNIQRKMEETGPQ